VTCDLWAVSLPLISYCRQLDIGPRFTVVVTVTSHKSQSSLCQPVAESQGGSYARRNPKLAKSAPALEVIATPQLHC